MPASERESVPRSLGRYEVVGHLASGGMAEILLGRLSGPSGFERAVVLKRILPHLTRDRRFREMLADEARVVARIHHPNVVQVYELCREEHELFLVMEYLEGESLGGLMRRLFCREQSLDPVLAAHVMAETAAGLDAAHELTGPDGRSLDLVHRDVTPQNVFITYAGAVKLLDFGIAKSLDRTARTETGTVKGKFQYMSPEQCLGKPLDRRSDIFALGILLYELTTGHRLFKRSSELLTFRAICEEPLTPPSQLVPSYPRALENTVLRALARRPSDRHATALELRRELSAFIHSTGEHQPSERLSALMRASFVDRILQKSEMLRKVSQGAPIGDPPAAEADESVDLPAVTQAGTQLTLSGPSRSKRRRFTGAALVLALLAAGGLGVLAFATAGPRPAKLGAGLEPAKALLFALPSRKPEPAREPKSVRIEIQSTPSGADVLVGGDKRGTTPMTLELGAGGPEIEIELRADGFAPLARKITPDQSHRLVLSLERAGKAKPRPRATGGKRPDDDFTRFQ